MTPPPGQQSEAHFKFLGSEVDLKGKAAKSVPTILALLAIMFSLICYKSLNTLGDRFTDLDKKVDKVLFILAEQ